MDRFGWRSTNAAADHLNALERKGYLKIDRTKSRGFHRYQLWEPIVGGSTYAVTRRDREGATWGLARTRRPVAPLTDYDAQVEHEIAEAHRAVDVMRRTVAELALRDDRGQPAGIADALYESRGDVILMTDPAAAAARAQSQRGAR